VVRPPSRGARTGVGPVGAGSALSYNISSDPDLLNTWTPWPHRNSQGQPTRGEAARSRTCRGRWQSQAGDRLTWKRKRAGGGVPNGWLLVINRAVIVGGRSLCAERCGKVDLVRLLLIAGRSSSEMNRMCMYVSRRFRLSRHGAFEPMGAGAVTARPRQLNGISTSLEGIGWQITLALQGRGRTILGILGVVEGVVVLADDSCVSWLLRVVAGRRETHV
jgi:hypothetical protein